MRTTLGIALAAATLSALLSACSTTGSQATSPTGDEVASDTATSAPSTPSTPSTPATSTPATSTPSSPAGSASATPTAHPTPAATTRCHTSDLSAALGAKAGTGQTTVPVVYTNTSGHTCTMYGFGGVDLHGPQYPTYGPVYSLPRQQAAPLKVTLAPGGHAHVTITYLLNRGQAARSQPWRPAYLLITPPDETTSLRVAWTTGDAVVRQDGATHPGTYISPVTAGSR